ncbi:FkbM family methyltransferase [Aliirhizobium smilacinae]|uniref:FkbM family methyltransferase n=1 Tax=Aliirhizobium smilacinae TaxID=1395944 RepID=A0A5C4XS69_9HYPH|nr:FkbM family methyltransferase [Rhizobium smilacinae]TNM66153.1 FkbM family methyltransferase [Rhizobium smilacinae]
MDIFELLGIESKIEIVDAGASLGGRRTIYQEIAENGWAHIVGFEPSKDELVKLNAQKKAYERYFPFFLGSGCEEVFYECSSPFTSSIFEPNKELLDHFSNLGDLCRVEHRHMITTKRIDDIEEIEDIDFFKLDIQGAELSVLQNGLEKLSSAVVVQVEVEFVELYRGQPLFADVDAFMRTLGFQFHTFESIGGRPFKPFRMAKSANLGINQLLWADAVYVRDWMKPESLPSQKLRKCALILDMCYGSVDLAHRILEEHDRIYGSDFSRIYQVSALRKERSNRILLVHENDT